MMPSDYNLLGSSLLLLALVGAGCSPPPTEVNPGTIGSASGSGPGTSTTGSGPDSLDGTADTGDTEGGTGDTGPVFDPVCGDGIIEGDEECDLGDQNGMGDYCTTECLSNVCGDGYLGPGEACDDGNANNNDQCTTSCGLASCGDGAIQVGEECDDGPANALDGACLPSCLGASCGDQQIQAGVETCDSDNTGAATCETQGYDRGVLECAGNCMSFDESNCHACGNNAIEPNEICDNNNYQGGVDCSDYAPGGTTVSGGSLMCVSNCTVINSNACTFCGDDMREGTETCDGNDFNGAVCQDFAGAGETHAGGALACTNSCMTISSNACTFCGDDTQEGGETCDGSDLNGQDCVSQGFVGGVLSCMNGCGAFDTSGCTSCGNNVQEGAEDCDGPDLGGATCSSEVGAGYRGMLACDGSCNFDTGPCCLAEDEPCGASSECCSNDCANDMGTDVCQPE